MGFNYLVIEGNIGVGKTSLAKSLANDTNARLILEQFEENPFLPLFYQNKDKYAFPVELTFLADRYQQLNNQIAPQELFQEKTISDYYFMKSLLFSRETLKKNEYSLYRRLFDIIQQQIPKPDLYVYLHAHTDKLLANISRRGREYEKNLTTVYLEKIQNGYFEYFKSNPDMTFVVIDVNEVDFVNNSDDYQRIKNIILAKQYFKGMNMIIP
ncbi:MAG TPA: deoxynucleoside kinase [Bacteroidales bacterium]|nr:deoxynucleoside kinase [Bacteroidales bacterium]